MDLVTRSTGAADLGWPEPIGRTRVKICGLSDPDTAAQAVAAGADMVGLVHFPPSPRHVSTQQAKDVVRAVAGGAFVVALTVDADDETLDAFIEAVRPDALQLHGQETPAHVAECATRYALPVAKAFGVAGPADMTPLSGYAALPVIDAKPPRGADRPGGHGKTFDWAILQSARLSGDYMLSGGLRPDNVADAVRQLSPYAVDVSSGVETAGRKDVAKIEAFIEATRTP